MRRFRTILFLAIVPGFLFFRGGLLRAGDWPGFRGPTGLGYTEEKDLPLTWNGKKMENILWKVPIKGGGPKADFTSPGHSCPIVWGDRVFITTATWPAEMTEEKERRKVIAAHHFICFRASDGKELWDVEIPAGKTVNNNVYHGYTVPTPVTDGKHVFGLFGSGVLVSLDFDGKIIWREELPGLKETDSGFSTSLVLYNDLIIVPGFEKIGLRALEKATGKLKWEQKKTDRNVQSTPAIIQVGDKKQLIHCAGNVQSLDPDSGDQLWFCRGVNTSWASPAFANGLVYVDSGTGGKGNGGAIDPTGKGDVSKTHLKWTTESKGFSGTSPIIVGDYVYRISEPGMIRCWKLATGELVYEERAQKVTPSSSPFATADERIYFASPIRTFVIKAGPKYEVLATNDLELEGGSQDYTSAAVSGGRIFFKGRSFLWCVGKK